jgi:hypothetical protein
MPYYRLVCLMILVGVLAISCSKKAATTPADTVAPTNAAADAPPVADAAADAPPVANADTQVAPPPAVDASAVGVDSKIAEANAALKAKEFDKALAAFSVPLQSLGPMTGDQLVAYNSAKAAFSQQVIAAAAAGDPKAQAALAILRQNAFRGH